MAITEAEAAAYAALAALERARETLWQKGRGKLMTYRPNAWEVARTIAMKRRKAKLNRRSDREARVLVGARLPRQEAFEIQREAERRGQSLYSFVRETLNREVHWDFK